MLVEVLDLGGPLGSAQWAWWWCHWKVLGECNATSGPVPEAGALFVRSRVSGEFQEVQRIEATNDDLGGTRNGPSDDACIKIATKGIRCEYLQFQFHTNVVLSWQHNESC